MMTIARVQRSDLNAVWNEIARLWEENRLLREKLAQNWDLSEARFRVRAGGSYYGSYETCAANDVWYDFTNISVTITTTVTCNFILIASCSPHASTSAVARAAYMRTKLNATGGQTAFCHLACSGADRYQELSALYVWKNCIAGTYTAKMQRKVNSETTDTCYYYPSLAVFAVPV